MKVKKTGFLLHKLHLFHQKNRKEVAIPLFSELNEESLAAFDAAGVQSIICGYRPKQISLHSAAPF